MIEKHLYTSEQKTTWFGEGEWVNEPDFIEFEHYGLKCVVCRNCQQEPCEEFHMYGGYLNGYVNISEQHACYGKDIDDLNLDVHGGITLCEIVNGVGWIGFDCAHLADLVPSMEQMRLQIIGEMFPISSEFRKYSILNPTYRNVQYVISECKKLAEQLKNEQT
jgi:hypothetical protein